MVKWRKIPGYTKYKVSDDGRVWSAYKKGELKQHVGKKDGYVRVPLCKDGKRDAMLVHRLVAIVFLGERSNKSVNHIDGNKENNHLINLKWVSSSENMTHCAYKLGKNSGLHIQEPLNKNEVRKLYKEGYSYDQLARMLNVSKGTIRNIIKLKLGSSTTIKPFSILENEIVKPIPDFPMYFASNLGRILSEKSGKAMKPQQHTAGYMKVCLYKDGKRYSRYVHRLVLSAFCSMPNKVVNHINRNATDNRLENLEWISQSDNVKHSAHRKLSSLDVNNIIKLKDAKEPTKEIATMYDVTPSHINRLYRKSKK